MPATRLRVFISSVQKEFEQVRSDLKAFLLGDAVLRRFISEVFLFEELPAADRRPGDVYLEEVARCDIYLGIFGKEYGPEDGDGVSATEREYDHASKHGKTRLVYVWGADDSKRAPKMLRLVRKASGQLIRRRVPDVSALTAEVYASLVDHLDRMGALRTPPFDTAACKGVNLGKLSRKRVDWFLETARRARGFPLKTTTTTESLLAHLNLLADGTPTNAAVLLFCADPQRFHRTAETKCVRCDGTEYRRPFASQQVYGGDLFEQVDQARDFVLAKINRAVGTRVAAAIAPATYDLPPDAVTEAIVNAVAHRDYNSNASVEVRLFTNRLEVWNPGILPCNLTTAGLRTDHPSVPNNPLLAESLYLVRYIEKVGSGTQAMIEQCREAGLPEPDFEQRQGSFVVTLWRDRLTNEIIASLGISDRQGRALAQVRKVGRITNSDYQKIAGVTRKTAVRDLDALVAKGVLERVGEKRGSHYVLARGK